MTYVTNIERIGEKRGEKKGEKKRERVIVIKMLEKGYPIKDIIEITGLSKEEIMLIKKSSVV